jgi:hypothetical protein
MLMILPDSNALFGRLIGTRPDEDWLALLELSSSGQIAVVLPEIVQWEIANQAQREVVDLLDRHRATTSKLRRLGIEAPAFGDGPMIGKERVAQATEELRKQVLEKGGRIAPIPNVSHAELVRRSLDRRRPFDGEDRGYRDTLLWHTALELLREGHSVVLVSNDKSAFVSPGADELLHPDLDAELRAYGYSAELHLAKSLDRARILIAGAMSPERQRVAHLLARDEIAAEIMHCLCVTASGEVFDEKELLHWGWSEDLAGVRVLEIKDFGGLRPYKVSNSPKGRLKAKVRIDVIAELDVRAFDFTDEINDMATPGPIHDVGVGLTDGLIQTYVDRELTLVGEIDVSRSQDLLHSVSLTGIELPRNLASDGQLALGYQFNDFAA